MDLDNEGHLRPRIIAPPGTSTDAAAETKIFKSTCPGVALRPYTPQGSGSVSHPVFGSYVEAWEAWAEDDTVRHAGSSGGVITAMSQWLAASGNTRGTICAIMDTSKPVRSAATIAKSQDETIAAAGSRYAPVSNLQLLGDAEDRVALVGKPCEVSAYRRLSTAREENPHLQPPLLSFFCAGTPSQGATDRLVRKLGTDPEQVSSLRYRGGGWPGEFAVTAANGASASVSYEEAWGRNLGTALPWRCKLCPDGTGGDADIAVGDYWETDERGFPVFDDQPGRSVCIARTERGRQWVLAAADQGIINLRPVRLDMVANIQPLQTERKRTLLYRLLGRLVSGKSIPKYRGYGLLRATDLTPAIAVRACGGTIRRSIRPPFRQRGALKFRRE